MKPRRLVSIGTVIVAVYVGFSQHVGDFVYSMEVSAIVGIPAAFGIGGAAVAVFLWGMGGKK